MIPAYATLLESSDLFTATGGRFGDLLERKTGAEDVAFTSDGRNALHLALKDAGLKRGDEAIIPGYTCRAVPEAVAAACKPVFADIDAKTFNVHVSEIKKRLSKKTKALVVVHSYGNPCEMQPIRELADKNGLILVEDCAQSISGTYKGRPLGSFGDYAVLSFRFSKDITCFRGGALLSKSRIENKPGFRPSVDMTRAKLCGLMAGEAALKLSPGSLHHAVVGLAGGETFRESGLTLTEYQLSILERQFMRLPGAIEKRRRNAMLYVKGLRDIAEKIAVQKETKGHTYYRFTIRARQAGPLQEFLLNRGIQADRMYDYSISGKGESKRLAAEAVNLPVHHKLKPADIKHITGVLHEFF
jgi:dTDP-4-amino-4,6-dideoxygalactose transaminase